MRVGESVKELVLQVGGKVTHELRIINAVGARLTAAQQAELLDHLIARGEDLAHQRFVPAHVAALLEEGRAGAEADAEEDSARDAATIRSEAKETDAALHDDVARRQYYQIRPYPFRPSAI